ncbi:amino acid/amide ABC transporter ATP-binding protein 2, HAAT family [Nitrobacter winogradskyi Nb-255]|uniref:Amino acid/amide ABC transporter ATP-binding protein 2, HAAT family n=1 Tax=Nitrobacter winogradskyi (strain ATCC 25391 / DSM 10237 / CIP 104748 / NCIMB 11846 / Nb-255) TaxID=323098 RepID=Q3SUV6_NITWN|nr:ABC transporter ATP-binding protein [Nitrobacter winogradskyi]ABA03935.1 amino acid/amide ABC transporter ATP-binding protein 2, HAAT family [Nitrobacter winogradskyi Nb-255]
MLSVADLHVNYGRAEILHGVSLDVGDKPVSVVGRNGMGKTTFCYAIMGMIPVRSGSIALDNEPLDRKSAMQVARRGIAIVPQGRRVFPSLSVDEHLKLASRSRKAAWTPERIYETFPRLAERRSNGGAQLSGGEQQMLAIARALLRNPRLIIMDEPSEGLAPVIVDQLIDTLRKLTLDKIGLLLIEQNLRVATSVSDTVAVMLGGKIAATLPAKRLSTDEALQRRYLGVSSALH